LEDEYNADSVGNELLRVDAAIKRRHAVSGANVPASNVCKNPDNKNLMSPYANCVPGSEPNAAKNILCPGPEAWNVRPRMQLAFDWQLSSQYIDYDGFIIIITILIIIASTLSFATHIER
jgi:hypothetical protein